MMLSAEQRSLLLDIANTGCQKGLVADARVIYNGILAETPGFAPALIGLAFSHVVIDEFAEAERILKEEVLAENPHDADALAMLGLSLFLDKRVLEAREILAPLAEAEGSAADFAGELLPHCLGG